jgi:hypothetical protein
MQEICNLCWSLVALDRLSPETLTKLTSRLETLGALEGLTDAQSQQLLLAEEQCPDALPRAVHLKAWRVANERIMPSTISRCGVRISHPCLLGRSCIIMFFPLSMAYVW